MVHTVNELLDQRQIVAAPLIAFGKGDIGLRHGFLQVLEQQLGNTLGSVRQIDETHHKGVFMPVVVNGLTDLGPVTGEYSMCHAGNTALEHLLGSFGEVGIRR